MIKLICFDLDDTLWPVNRVLQNAEQQLLNWLVATQPELAKKHDLDSLHRLRLEIAKQYPQLQHDLTQLRIRSLVRLFASAGYKARESKQMAQAGFDVFYAARNTVTFYPGAMLALSKLNKKYTLASVTNGNACLRQVGITHYFPLQFSPQKANEAKPGTAMFEAAIDAAGCQPHEAIHIGDHPALDILPAQTTGMHTIWANFENRCWPYSEINPKMFQQTHQNVMMFSELERAINNVTDISRPKHPRH